MYVTTLTGVKESIEIWLYEISESAYVGTYSFNAWNFQNQCYDSWYVYNTEKKNFLSTTILNVSGIANLVFIFIFLIYYIIVIIILLVIMIRSENSNITHV